MAMQTPLSDFEDTQELSLTDFQTIEVPLQNPHTHSEELEKLAPAGDEETCSACLSRCLLECMRLLCSLVFH